MTKEERKQIIADLLKYNTLEYNIAKATEELQELSLILTQKLLKPNMVKEQQIIDEIGDVFIRLQLLMELYNKEGIVKRINMKLTMIKIWMANKSYGQI